MGDFLGVDFKISTFKKLSISKPFFFRHDSELRLKTEMKKLRKKQQLEMANQLKEAAELEEELNKSKAENKERKAEQMKAIRQEQEGIEADRLEKEGPIVVAEKKDDKNRNRRNGDDRRDRDRDRDRERRDDRDRRDRDRGGRDDRRNGYDRGHSREEVDTRPVSRGIGKDQVLGIASSRSLGCKVYFNMSIGGKKVGKVVIRLYWGSWGLRLLQLKRRN